MSLLFPENDKINQVLIATDNQKKGEILAQGVKDNIDTLYGILQVSFKIKIKIKSINKQKEIRDDYT